MLYYNEELYFSKLGKNDSIWSAILEKAWAKLMGTYEHANGGFLSSGIRALTGIPVFNYLSDEQGGLIFE